MKKIFIKGMEQIGDTLYSRPFVKRLVEEDGHDVYIQTVHPKLYTNLTAAPINFVRPTEFKLRTPKQEFLTDDTEYVEKPNNIEQEIDFQYNVADLRVHGVSGSIEKRFGFSVGSTNLEIGLPTLTSYRIKIPPNKKLAIIRPVTHRSEFPCTSRSPDPEYVGWCGRMLQDAGYYVVSLADTVIGQESLVGEAPVADVHLLKGQLGILGALSLIADAKVVVGGSGFIIPAAVQAGVPLFVLFGGRGAYDNPQKVFDLRMNLKTVGWALPDNFCRCNKNEHDCDKSIKNLDSLFWSFMKNL